MTKEQEKEFKELFEAKIKEATYRGVVRGFKAAYDTMIEQINLGMSLEEIKTWATKKRDNTKIVEKALID